MENIGQESPGESLIKAGPLTIRTMYVDEANHVRHTSLLLMDEMEAVQSARDMIGGKFRAYVDGSLRTDQFGLYLRSQTNPMAGWMDLDRTLRPYGIGPSDIVEYRALEQTLRVRGSTQAHLNVTVRVPTTMGSLTRLLLEQMGVSNIVLLHSKMLLRGVVLDSAANPLELNIPSRAMLSVVMPNGSPLPRDVEEAVALADVFMWTPFYHGELLKKSNSGLVRNWKKRWFVLQHDTLTWYRSENDTVPLGAVHLSDLSAVRVDDHYADAAVRRAPQQHFVLTTMSSARAGSAVVAGDAGGGRFIGGRMVHLLAASGDQRTMWVDILRDWMNYRYFYSPTDLQGTVVKRMLNTSLSRVVPLSSKSSAFSSNPSNSSNPSSSHASSSSLSSANGVMGGMDSSLKSNPPVVSARAAFSRPSPSLALISAQSSSTAVSAQPPLPSPSSAAMPISNLHAPFRRQTFRAGPPSHADVPASGGEEVEQAGPGERLVQLALRREDAALSFIVEESVDVYDLAYTLACEVGDAVDEYDDVDFVGTREVDLLDHQASLAELRLPPNARLTLRKSGAASSQQDPLVDTHFLFVFLPQLYCEQLWVGRQRSECRAELQGPCVVVELLGPEEVKDEAATTRLGFLCGGTDSPPARVRRLLDSDIESWEHRPRLDCSLVLEPATPASVQSSGSGGKSALLPRCTPFALEFPSPELCLHWESTLKLWIPYFERAGYTSFDAQMQW